MIETDKKETSYIALILYSFTPSDMNFQTILYTRLDHSYLMYALDFQDFLKFWILKVDNEKLLSSKIASCLNLFKYVLKYSNSAICSNKAWTFFKFLNLFEIKLIS